MNAFTKKASRSNNEKAVKSINPRQRVLFACDVAMLVLPMYEKDNPKDRRPRKAIELAEKYIMGEASHLSVTSAVNAMWVAVTEAADRHKHIMESAAWAANTIVWKDQGETPSFINSMEAICVVNATATARLANPKVLPTIRKLFIQMRKIEIPQSPLLKSIAKSIVQTRNFEEYYVLLDNLEEVHNIQLERKLPLGLSHYVIFALTNTN